MKNVEKIMGNITTPFIKIKSACTQTVTCSNKNKNKLTKHTKSVVCGEKRMKKVWQEYKEVYFLKIISIYTLTIREITAITIHRSFINSGFRPIQETVPIQKTLFLVDFFILLMETKKS